MKIRRGKLNDAKEILRILKETPELSGNKDEEIVYTPQFVNGALTHPDRDLVLIAEEDGKIIGFLIAELWEHKEYSYLIDVYIKQEFRRQGIASKLFEEYEKYCKNNKMNVIVGLVLVDNKVMQKWCDKHEIKQGNKFYLYEKKLK